MRPASGPYAIYDRHQGVETYFDVGQRQGWRQGRRRQDATRSSCSRRTTATTRAARPARVKKLVEQDQRVRAGRRHRHRDQPRHPRLHERQVRARSSRSAPGRRSGARRTSTRGTSRRCRRTHSRRRSGSTTSRRRSPTPRSPSSTSPTTSVRRTRRRSRRTSRAPTSRSSAEESFDPLGGTTTEAAVTQLSQSGADVFIVGHRRHALPEDAEVHARRAGSR